MVSTTSATSPSKRGSRRSLILVRQKKASSPTSPHGQCLDQIAHQIRRPGHQVHIEMKIVAVRARRDFGEQAGQDPHQRLVDLLRTGRSLHQKRVNIRCHHICRHCKLNCGPMIRLGTASRKSISPRKRETNRPPRTLVSEVENEKRGRHLVRDRQSQKQSGQRVVAMRQA